MPKLLAAIVVFVLLLASLTNLSATETENVGIRVVPAPGKVAVDGQLDDWDLSGGVFICGDVEGLRDKVSVWAHAMHDNQFLYLLARWNDDTPLNNPGQTIADYGFAGDCLQFRVTTAPETPRERTSHWTCWKGRDGADVMDVQYGKQFNDGGNLKNAKSSGAQQAFVVNADGKGYVQELAIPWAQISKGSGPPTAGSKFILTVEPNFTVGANGRLSLKDVFKPGVTPDRVFTFMAANTWGPASVESKGHLKPAALRLADAREFPISLDKGLPVIDWTGLIKSPELPGFKPIEFELPADAYISLNINDTGGAVVRQLLNGAFFTKGKHTVKWDGLTTPNWKQPGQSVPPGEYQWSALYHSGIGLELRGWAGNSGIAPWDNGPGTNWGGDHGLPVAVASDADKVYLGWNGAEAGKALLACDLEGRVVWNNIRGGIAGVKAMAVDGGVVFVLGGLAGPPSDGANMYKLDAKTGSYLAWTGSDDADITIKTLFGGAEDAPEKADSITARGGKIYLSFKAAGKILVLDAANGKLLKTIEVPAPTEMAWSGDNGLLVVSGGQNVLSIDLKSGAATPAVSGLKNARGLAVDAKGRVYVGVGEPENQIRVYQDGKLATSIGRAGGRALLGKWTSDGVRFVNSLTVDASGQLWCAEADGAPKRISVWNAASGKFAREFFGPSSYGALGGAINPADPNIMVGQGCEWRLDSKTGQSECLGVITRDGMENSRFGIVDKHVYLAVAANWAFNIGPIKIYERVGDADYKLRTVIFYLDEKGNEVAATGHGEIGKIKKSMVWSDANGDGQRQADEVIGVDGELRFSGWYMFVGPDLSLYSTDRQFKLAGLTSCGAPRYDLNKPTKMPAVGLGSADSRLVLQAGEYNTERSWFKAFDIASGKLNWSYPDNFVGVHGSHQAIPPETGMIRGSFGPTGSVKLPAPIGNVWVIPTNVGEWHLLNENGFYIAKLFQPDPLKVKYPEKALPGASVNDAPPGMGGEDFGGSATLGVDGKLYIQAGKTAYWNLVVTGLDTVQKLAGGKVAITQPDVAQALKLRDEQLQASVGTRRVELKKMTPKFTGNLDNDFKGAQIISFKKQDDAAARAAATWDESTLYLAWNVRDATPWLNTADAADQMYVRGDTVDFQLGADPAADKNRAEPALGDLRVSIGNFQGAPTAVLYRKLAKNKKPKVFSSGVIKSYPLDFVDVLSSAKITVNKRGDGYLVEAAIPLADLDLSPSDGLSLRGDFGVTHGDAASQRTRLRSYWNNQHTGLVDDAVFELMLEPRYWGELIFKQ